MIHPFLLFDRLRAVREDLIDQTVFLCLFSGEEVITVGIAFDLLERLARICGKDLVEALLGTQNMIGVNLDIRSLTLHTAERLVDHDLGIGQCDTLALCAGGKQERAHACSHTDTDGGNITLDEVHRIVDRHTCGNGSAGAVDIQADVLVGVLCFQKQKLRDNERCGLIVDLIGEEMILSL